MKYKSCKEIFLRDPFVMNYNGKYYLYGTRSETAFVGQAYGFDVYISDDLKNWRGPVEAFRRPDGFWSRKSYWAPEVVCAHDRFYMFATFADQLGGLGTAVLTADHPEGPFSLWSDGYVTPQARRCLDGTLHIAADGTPYMVFCHEWRQIRDGSICAVRLSDDLREAKGEPFLLFHASEAKPYVKPYFFRNYVTDGPFLIRTDDGRLHLLWSTYTKKGYVQAMAHSDTDELTGKWTPDAELLYDRNGGHGMIFRDQAGQYQMCLHQPNTFRREHPTFYPLEYRNSRFYVQEENR
ncbi:MAG: family 43 glycosylhydrolase [Oscillospiraceae bacterium]|nr:family 43 glycosylhydrolase [Oscillospiraceae bacterium]MBQ9045820.1 family 43 glycosylhydrolase [Oscillospiraceae bacterium]